MDSAGRMKPIRVRTGINDGQKTQVSGRELVLGMQVIVGSAGATAGGAASGATANPFQQQRQGQGGPPGPRGF